MTRFLLYKFSDSGHGWLEILRTEVNALGIADKISGFSYQKGNMVYLEEDCDMAIYLDAIGYNEDDYLIIENHINGQSEIRSYDSYKQGYLSNLT